MYTLKQFVVPAWLLMASGASWAAVPPGGDVQQLREELNRLRTEYESRITELERRLDAAEQTAESATAAAGLARDEARRANESLAVRPAPAQTVSGGSMAAANAFNPAISVIFQGQAWSYEDPPEAFAIPGFPLGGEAGLAPEGFSLAETEIDVSANVDDKFTAWLTLPLVVEDGETEVEIEEAWIETLALPAGMSLRAGRMFSNIGYLNDKHSHAWDFADQALVYQAFLGSQYIDDGVQFRWLAPTDLFLELSGELMRGDRFPAGGAADSGLGGRSLSVKLGGDVGISHGWLAGFSWLNTESIDRPSGDEADPLLFTGDTDLYLASFVWKWAPFGNWRERNFILQAEYMWRDEDGEYTLPDGAAMPWDQQQNGWYAQAVFQPFPQWRVGARYDHLGGDVPGPEWRDTPLFSSGDDPTRWSLMVDWSNSEFSRVRLQYNRDDSGETADNRFGLQYIHSIGAHGAHSF